MFNTSQSSLSTLSFQKLCDLQKAAMKDLAAFKLGIFKQTASAGDLAAISAAQTLYGDKAGAEIFEALFAPGAGSAPIDSKGENFIARVWKELAPDIAMMMKEKITSESSIIATETLERIAATGSKRALEIAVATSVGLPPGMVMYDMATGAPIEPKPNGKATTMHGGIEFLTDIKIPKGVFLVRRLTDGRRIVAMNEMCFTLRDNVVVFFCSETGELTV